MSLTDSTPRNEEESNVTTPIKCSLDRQLGLFRIERSRGKTIQTGGFGIVMPKAKEDGDDDAPVHPDMYLFLEEVLFLFERGLLTAYTEDRIEMDRYRLYQCLSLCGVELAVYNVYVHLRQQMYKVVRHTAGRGALLRSLQENPEGKAYSELRRNLRADAASAPNYSVANVGIAFDVYNPKSNYSRTNPGLPDFYVSIHWFSYPLNWKEMQAVLELCKDIPLKLAAVSDSGSVRMLGISEHGVPVITSS